PQKPWIPAAFHPLFPAVTMTCDPLIFSMNTFPGQELTGMVGNLDPIDETADLTPSWGLLCICLL
ncbi:MAG: hypothetical protein EBZ48_12085, partial [Proteobacteria bacterium]|nr:hypothetical protein [Pseudomonadota bacterium]